MTASVPGASQRLSGLQGHRNGAQASGGGDRIALVAGNAGLTAGQVRAAVAYYAAYPEDVDRMVAEADRAEESALAAGILCVATRTFPDDARIVGALTTALELWAESGRDVTGIHWFL